MGFGGEDNEKVVLWFCFLLMRSLCLQSVYVGCGSRLRRGDDTKASQEVVGGQN